MEQFDAFDFENYLVTEFFDGNELSDIKKEIKDRLENDFEFAQKYELWIDDSGYDSWREFYKELKGEEAAAWENMFPDGDENDAISDYLTKD